MRRRPPAAQTPSRRGLPARENGRRPPRSRLVATLGGGRAEAVQGALGFRLHGGVLVGQEPDQLGNGGHGPATVQPKRPGRVASRHRVLVSQSGNQFLDQGIGLLALDCPLRLRFQRLQPIEPGEGTVPPKGRSPVCIDRRGRPTCRWPPTLPRSDQDTGDRRDSQDGVVFGHPGSRLLRVPGAIGRRRNDFLGAGPFFRTEIYPSGMSMSRRRMEPERLARNQVAPRGAIRRSVIYDALLQGDCGPGKASQKIVSTGSQGAKSVVKRLAVGRRSVSQTNGVDACRRRAAHLAVSARNRARSSFRRQSFDSTRCNPWAWQLSG